MKPCKVYKADICERQMSADSKYVYCGTCRKYRAAQKRNSYVKKGPIARTKVCLYCKETFTTEPSMRSHSQKYCNSTCKKAARYLRESTPEVKARKKEYRKINRERLKQIHKQYYERTKVLCNEPKERVCPTCNKSFITQKLEKGYGSYKKYCGAECRPHSVKTKQKEEEKRRLGRTCEWCQKHIDYSNASVHQLRSYKNARFCSSSCVQKNRMSIPKNAIAARFRILVNHALKTKGGRKTNKTFAALGYTKENLKTRIESQFTEGMSWDNMHLWHLDHIRPVASFDFDSTDHPEFKECWALENLQPLWAKDNMRKNAIWNGVNYRGVKV